MGDTSSRKMEHIKMVAEAGVEARESTLLEYVRIIYNPTTRDGPGRRCGP